MDTVGTSSDEGTPSLMTIEPPDLDAVEPTFVGPHAGERWAMAIMTAAHYELDEYKELVKSPPVGGISALTAVALSGITMYGITQGLTPEQALHGFALQVDADCPAVD